jgi:hypothetical protein
MIKEFNLVELRAETDADTKDFYAKLNFEVKAFEGEFCIRYKCKWKNYDDY